MPPSVKTVLCTKRCGRQDPLQPGQNAQRRTFRYLLGRGAMFSHMWCMDVVILKVLQDMYAYLRTRYCLGQRAASVFAGATLS